MSSWAQPPPIYPCWRCVCSHILPIFLLLTSKSSLYIPDINSLSDICFANLSMGCNQAAGPCDFSFHFIKSPFNEQQVILMKYNVSVHFPLWFRLLCLTRKSFPSSRLKFFSFMFSFRSSRVFCLAIKSIIYFQLVFVYDVRYCLGSLCLL